MTLLLEDSSLRAMPHNLSRRTIESIEAEKRRKVAEEQARIAEQATVVVGAWLELIAKEDFVYLWPTIGAAIAAGKPWLTFFCPGCQIRGAVDLRVIAKKRRFHPQASIEVLVPSLSCQRCRPQPPHARLTGLSEHQPHATFRTNAEKL